MLLHLNEKPFNSIKNGKKIIELRLNDEKRQNLKVNDIIEFENRLTNEVIKTILIEKKVYKNFEELYKNYSKEELGYESNAIASYKDMEQYYKKEEQEKYGVVALRIKLID